MSFELYEHQKGALENMKNGCILCGGVGSGKSMTALAYYYLNNSGKISSLCGAKTPSLMKNPMDLYIITTARKRDECEWLGDMAPFYISTNPKATPYKHNVVIDSWNNIKKYVGVKNAFFIFDEQRVVGYGIWSRSFIKIAHQNKWILLSATPGDTWTDYIPVFIANGFYKNKKQFEDEHVVYRRFSKFPQIDRYVNTRKLVRLRDKILVDMDFKRETISHHEDVVVSYDRDMYKHIFKNWWNPFTDEPIQNASEMCYTLRKVVNTDYSRQLALMEIFEKHPKMIVFYNFNYELEILKELYFGDGVEIAEWNGHKHQPIPTGDSWVYLVQYTAGAEGWNCTYTDTIVFFSQNYSYKVVTQSAGRIDRLNTPYTHLYYYHLKSKAPIDIGIGRALNNKKKFNENRWLRR